MWIDDDILKRCAEPVALSCFVPSSPCVVLGSSNEVDVEVNAAACHAAGISIVKRYGGGGTVLLNDKVVVVSVGAWVRQHFQNKFYFERLNQALIDSLAAAWPQFAELGQAGLSDVVWRGRKVVGTSLFRSRNYLLYQASILIKADIPAFEAYLRHPSREPEYRQGRSHADFLVGLAEIDPGVTSAQCVVTVNRALPATLQNQLAEELIAPQPEQFANLMQRAELARLQ